MPAAPAPPPPRLLDLVRQAALAHYGRPEPAERSVQWARRFILFHKKRHPRELGAAEVVHFLQHVARTEKNAVDLLFVAHEALAFLYDNVLGLQLGEIVLPQPPRLLDHLRMALRVRHYSPRTEACYADWAERYIRFHGLRHPKDMGAAEVSSFLTDLAVNGHVAASTQNQALNALVFLYTQVLGLELGRLQAVHAQRPKRLPIVLPPEEIRLILDAVDGGKGVFRLMASLLYGAGLRRAECCAAARPGRGCDALANSSVRHGKGAKDRVVMLPKSLHAEVRRQLEWRRALHESDLAAASRVALPDALSRKFPRAAQEFGWQFLFASRQPSRDPKTGDIGRHHVHPGALARAVTLATRRPASTAMWVATLFGTASLRTSSSAASISAPCRYFWATRAWRRR